jgi:hypothetical protein
MALGGGRGATVRHYGPRTAIIGNGQFGMVVAATVIPAIGRGGRFACCRAEQRFYE